MARIYLVVEVGCFDKADAHVNEEVSTWSVLIGRYTGRHTKLVKTRLEQLCESKMVPQSVRHDLMISLSVSKWCETE